MNTIEYLLIFLAGIIFSDYIIPCFDGLLKVFLTWLECLKQAYAEKISESEVRINALSNPTTIVKKIGFTVEEKEEESKTEEEDTE